MAVAVAVADPTTGTARITVDYTPLVTGTLVYLYRVHPDGTEHAVVGSPAGLSNGFALFYDNAAPLDTDIQYRAALGDGFGTYDTYTRTPEANGWGIPTQGNTWAVQAAPLADYLTNGTQGIISVSVVNSERRITTDIGNANQDVYHSFLLSVTPTGAAINQGILLRYVDVNNYYWIDVQIDTAGGTTIRLIRRLAGVITVLGSLLTTVPHSTVDRRIIRARIDGTTLSAKIWIPAGLEPPGWQITVEDATILTGNRVGVIGRLTTGNTNALPVVLNFDNFVATIPGQESSVLSNTINIATAPDGWLKNPVLPTANVRIDNCDVHSPNCLEADQLVFFKALDTEEYQNASGIFPIVNSPRSLVVSELRKDLTTILTVVSRRLEDITAIRALLSTGEVLILSLPTIYGWGIESFGTDWIVVGDASATRIAIDMRKPYRIWQLPLALVDPDVAFMDSQLGGNNLGVPGSTWGDLAAAGLDWGDLSATGNTWLDTAQGDNY